MGIEAEIHSNTTLPQEAASLDLMESQGMLTNREALSRGLSHIAVIHDAEDSSTSRSSDERNDDLDSSYDSDDSHDDGFSYAQSAYHDEDDNSELSHDDDDDDDDDDEDNSVFSLEHDQEAMVYERGRGASEVTTITGMQSADSSESISEKSSHNENESKNVQIGPTEYQVDEDTIVAMDFNRDEISNNWKVEEDVEDIPIIDDSDNYITCSESQSTDIVDYEVLAQVVFANMKSMNNSDLERIIELSLHERERRMMVEHNTNAGVRVSERRSSSERRGSSRGRESSRRKGSCSHDSRRTHRSSDKNRCGKSSSHGPSSSQRRRRRRRKKKPMTLKRFIRRTRRAFRKTWTFKKTLAVFFGTVTLAIGIYVLTLFIGLITTEKISNR